ncbi:MAG: choice-of-anchor H family protein [Gammaproteobacteria bacterium]|nr:choice-of-anchor H family protein [Gammaproteobacteria bacterium]
MKQMTLRFGSPGLLLATGVVLTLLGVETVLAEAATAVRLSQSIEQVAEKTEEEQQQMLDLAMPQVAPALELSGSRVEVDLASKTLTAAHLSDQVFRIYDAKTLLSGDDDGDGFYHQLRVTFDADVDHGDALVYARLFMSYEGGPWNHYFTTDVFYIIEEVVFDDYEVVTRLLEGYPTGYYDVLIELYEADWDTHVASYGPYEDGALSAIPLEDYQRDDPGGDDYDYPVSDSHGGGGSIGLAGLMILGLWRRLTRTGQSHRTGSIPRGIRS